MKANIVKQIGYTIGYTLLLLFLFAITLAFGYLALSRLFQLPSSWQYYATRPPAPPDGCQGLTGSAYWHCMVEHLSWDIGSALFALAICLFTGYLLLGLLRGSKDHT
ncbi:hypothetical protein HRbin15_00744 [bacterium HR15]|nr:hypothetical protein HRbin15_00744 [bacterium HR15]